jgi:hypothetical protein
MAFVRDIGRCIPVDTDPFLGEELMMDAGENKPIS